MEEGLTESEAGLRWATGPCFRNIKEEWEGLLNITPTGCPEKIIPDLQMMNRSLQQRLLPHRFLQVHGERKGKARASLEHTVSKSTGCKK